MFVEENREELEMIGEIRMKMGRKDRDEAVFKEKRS